MIKHSLLILFLPVVSFANAQENKVAPTSKELFNEISLMDSMLPQVSFLCKYACEFDRIAYMPTFWASERIQGLDIWIL